MAQVPIAEHDDMIHLWTMQVAVEITVISGQNVALPRVSAKWQ